MAPPATVTPSSPAASSSPPRASPPAPRSKRSSGCRARWRARFFSDLINGALRGGDSDPPPASELAIQQLKRNVQAPAGAACAICLCELASAEPGSLTCMPCDHMFHEECLTQWLRSHNTCPVCRDTVEADDTLRPNSLAALLHGWRDARRRSEAAPNRARDAPPRANGGGAASSSR